MRTPLRRVLAAATAAALLLTAAACGGDDDAKAGGKPSKIVIGYQQIPNGDLVVKHNKWLEQAFGDGTTIEWKLFDSGGSVNEAIQAGSVDIGLVGSSPASRGISSGIKYRVPWIFDVIGKAEALAVKGGVTDIQSLKGKTIATPFASTSHYSLLAALQEAGLDGKSVKVIDSEPDAILAAWKRGDIDGAYVWNPVLAKLLADGGTTLVTSADLASKGKTTYDLAVVTDDFADKYPDAVKTWVAQQDKAVKLIKSDADAAATAIAAELQISPADAKAQMGDLIFVDAADQAGDEYLGKGLPDNLFATAKFNKDVGQITTVREQKSYTDAVDATFAKSVPQ
ncbi:ABC transporter substrate-binding protein [Cryptosporangium phraense]|uniref:Glycine/betaine ABC transporter substrate-binding protein n=1 Tax=Cryptosporangium phraense TaxID=2593070 RepID=A0A545AUK9_9ACTN|nr:ABC transporter substrate-binding protein [Cryptosporangium phraense]TQS45016.1 glycine/betaine ABC transporter substrate-binding protein [Cryptosporangium phraense]